MALIDNMFEDKDDLLSEQARKNTGRFKKSIGRGKSKFTLSRQARVPKVIGAGVKDIPRAKPKALTKQVKVVEDKEVEPVSVPKPKKAELTFAGIPV